MNVVIDVGNTRLKYAFFDGDRLVEAKYVEGDLLRDIAALKAAQERVDVLLSGSGKIEEGIRVELKRMADLCLEASPLMRMRLKLGYDTPGSLGVDRIAACTGAMAKQPGTPLLVIDSGTCITFNYVDAAGCFLGGNISPGLEMRFRALHEFTARLPFISPWEEYGGIGRSTDEAVRNGVMDGMLFETEAYIDRFRQDNPGGKVFVTGGNSRFLEQHLRREVEYCDCLGFFGLNAMLEYVKLCKK